MIKTLRIQNFRSVLDATLDFSFAEGKAPNGFATMQRIPFLQEPEVTFRGVPVLALFGANAAGKSNLLKAVDAFRRRAVGLQPGNYPFFQPEKLHGPLCPTAMEMVFFAKTHEFRYLLEADGSKIIREELASDNKIVYSIQGTESDFSALVQPAYPLENLLTFKKVEGAQTENGFIRRSFLSVLGHNYAGLDERVKTAYDFFERNIIPSASDNLGMKWFPDDVRTLAALRKSDERSVLADIAGIIRKLDVPIDGIAIVREKEMAMSSETVPAYQTWVSGRDDEGKPTMLHLQTFRRDENGNAVSFRLNEEESNGTQNLVYLVARMLLALERGGIMFVDELDKSLHPILVRSLLNLFVDRGRNRNGARLVFTTHCTDLMDDSILRVSEVGIVANGAKTGTRVRRLADLRAEGMDIRNVTDFRRNYLDGFYSGVPYPSL
ncbi:MAG: AAA family ATPase [Kiritimatiellae bacterium]|nr:AAA family ATPase [Kiritimatiellia bacterium]